MPVEDDHNENASAQEASARSPMPTARPPVPSARPPVPSARPPVPSARPSGMPVAVTTTPDDTQDIAPELVAEARVGATPLAADVNAALVALSRAARSFLLYDPRNAAVRSFLEDLQARMQGALAHGPMALEVRPFELTLKGTGEVVYLERDRERSLAFRMFRDGVRGLSLHPAVEWEEVLKLLEVLSIRYTGVRQQEDDIVTLLWKAGFQHIEVEAVEGFVPDEEMPEPGMDGESGGLAAATKRYGNRVAFPRDRDQPLPAPLDPVATAWADLPPEALDALREEDSSRALGRDVVRVVTEMLSVIADPTDPTTLADLLPFLGEARGFLLAEGQLPLLVDLVRALRSAVVEDPTQLDTVLAGFADRAALGHILHSVPHGVTSAPAELVDLLDQIPADHLTHLIDLLSEERGDGARSAARQLIARYTPRRASYVLGRLRKADPAVARDLLRACSEALPDEAVDAAMDLARVEDGDLAREVLDVLERAPRRIEVTRALVGLLASPLEDVRIEAAGVLARRREQTGFDAIVKRLEGGGREVSPEEAAAFGRALARLSPAHAAEVLEKWVRPGGVLSRWVARSGQRTLSWAAVAGLELLPGEHAEALLRDVMARSDEDLRRHAVAALARRRRAVEGSAASQPPPARPSQPAMAVTSVTSQPPPARPSQPAVAVTSVTSQPPPARPSQPAVPVASQPPPRRASVPAMPWVSPPVVPLALPSAALVEAFVVEVLSVPAPAVEKVEEAEEVEEVALEDIVLADEEPGN